MQMRQQQEELLQAAPVLRLLLQPRQQQRARSAREQQQQQQNSNPSPFLVLLKPICNLPPTLATIDRALAALRFADTPALRGLRDAIQDYASMANAHVFDGANPDTLRAAPFQSLSARSWSQLRTHLSIRDRKPCVLTDVHGTTHTRWFILPLYDLRPPGQREISLVVYSRKSEERPRFTAYVGASGVLVALGLVATKHRGVSTAIGALAFGFSCWMLLSRQERRRNALRQIGDAGLSYARSMVQGVRMWPVVYQNNGADIAAGAPLQGLEDVVVLSLLNRALQCLHFHVKFGGRDQ